MTAYTSNLLRELRAQADTVVQKRAEEQQVSREVAEGIDHKLHAIYRYFDEACKLLSVIKPPVDRRYEMPHVVRLEGMHFDDGLVTFRKRKFGARELFDYVAVYYRLLGPAPKPLKVEMVRSTEVERQLIAANIDFEAESDSRVRGRALHNVIRIAPGLRCEIRFDPDFVHDRIAVMLLNVDRFEPITLDFSSSALSDAVLDDLVNLMTGKASQFLFRTSLRGLSAGGLPR